MSSPSEGPIVGKQVSPVGMWCPGAHLAGEDLRERFGTEGTGAIVYLAGADLTGANLSGLNLTGFVLCGAKLVGADLSEVVIGDGEGAFPSANLAGADLSRASLANAMLRRVGFRGAKMTDVIWDGCQVEALKLHGHQTIGSDFTAASYNRRSIEEFIAGCGCQWPS